jgi:N-methylhydantoinase A
MSSATTYRIGVDVGGTFTDLVLAGSDGSVLTQKVPTTPDDYGRGIVDGISAAMAAHRIDAADIASVVHATTVATNTILEVRGARTALVTTRGFRDILEIGRQTRPHLFDYGVGALNWRTGVTDAGQ